MRAVIVFATSGSMRQSDPGRLRQVAATLFLALAGSQVMVGLATFSNYGVLIVGGVGYYGFYTYRRRQRRRSHD